MINMEKYEKVPLKELLEVIQRNLTFSIDSFYTEAKRLIGTEKQHNLGFLKEQLKERIEKYLKLVVKNIIDKTNRLVEARHYPPLYYEIKNQINHYLNEAIKE